MTLAIGATSYASAAALSLATTALIVAFDLRKKWS